MDIDTAEQVAQRRAQDAPCAVCGDTMCGVLLEQRRRRDDDFERVRCASTGRTFRRVWVAD